MDRRSMQGSYKLFTPKFTNFQAHFLKNIQRPNPIEYHWPTLSSPHVRHVHSSQFKDSVATSWLQFTPAKAGSYLTSYSQNQGIFLFYFEVKIHKLSKTYAELFIFHPLSKTYAELFISHTLSKTYAELFIFHTLSKTYTELFIFHTLSKTYAELFIFHTLSRPWKWLITFPKTFKDLQRLKEPCHM